MSIKHCIIVSSISVENGFKTQTIQSAKTLAVTLRQRVDLNLMEIRNSKTSNLSYAALGTLIILVVLIKSYFDQSVDNNLMIIFALFFGTISGYFILKAYDKRPLYIIDNKKVFIRKENLSYEFKDLSFYRHERIGNRYGRFDYIYFYNIDNLIVFKINVTVTDHSVKQIKNKLDKHLTEKRATANTTYQ